MIKSISGVTAFRCDGCGANLNVASAQNGSVTCGFCTTPFQLNFGASTTFSQAENALHSGNFNEAERLFLQAANQTIDNAQKASSFYGAAFARYGIQYIRNGNAARPVVNIPQNVPFSQDMYLNQALNFANVEQAISFRREAQVIDSFSKNGFNNFNNGFNNNFNNNGFNGNNGFNNGGFNNNAQNAGHQIMAAKRKVMFIIVGIVGAIIFLSIILPIVLGGAGGSTQITNPPSISTPPPQGGSNVPGTPNIPNLPPQTPSGAILPAGTWRVGYRNRDITPGDYILVPTSPVLATVSINLGPYNPQNIYSSSFRGRRYIRIEDMQYITVTNAAIWRVEDVATNLDARNFTQGQFLVGRDIRPGTYFLMPAGSPSASFFITNTPFTSLFFPDTNNVIRHSFNANQQTITLFYGQYIFFQNATLIRQGN